MEFPDQLRYYQLLKKDCVSVAYQLVSNQKCDANICKEMGMAVHIGMCIETEYQMDESLFVYVTREQRVITKDNALLTRVRFFP
jgi:hypothetical protein